MLYLLKFDCVNNYESITIIKEKDCNCSPFYIINIKVYYFIELGCYPIEVLLLHL